MNLFQNHIHLKTRAPVSASVSLNHNSVAHLNRTESACIRIVNLYLIPKSQHQKVRVSFRISISPNSESAPESDRSRTASLFSNSQSRITKCLFQNHSLSQTQNQSRVVRITVCFLNLSQHHVSVTSESQSASNSNACKVHQFLESQFAFKPESALQVNQFQTSHQYLTSEPPRVSQHRSLRTKNEIQDSLPSCHG